MLLDDWAYCDFSKLTATGWPADVDPAKTVLLEKNTLARPPRPRLREPAARGWSAIPTLKLSSRSSAPASGMLPRSTRCLDAMVARDDRRRRGRTAARQCDPPRVQVPPGNRTVRLPSSRSAARGRS